MGIKLWERKPPQSPKGEAGRKFHLYTFSVLGFLYLTNVLNLTNLFLPFRATKTPLRATSKNFVPEKYLYSSRVKIVQIIFYPCDIILKIVLQKIN
jgi:hypothetical protein